MNVSAPPPLSSLTVSSFLAYSTSFILVCLLSFFSLLWCQTDGSQHKHLFEVRRASLTTLINKVEEAGDFVNKTSSLCVQMHLSTACIKNDAASSPGLRLAHSHTLNKKVAYTPLVDILKMLKENCGIFELKPCFCTSGLIPCTHQSNCSGLGTHQNLVSSLPKKTLCSQQDNSLSRLFKPLISIHGFVNRREYMEIW